MCVCVFVFVFVCTHALWGGGGRSIVSAKSFVQPEYSISCKDGRSVLIMKETLWEGNLNFFKDIPMLYPNLSVIISNSF
jgi:hypothetical protein